MRKIRVPIFGTGSVPFGRRQDVLAALAHGITNQGWLAWRTPRGAWAGVLVCFPNRASLLRALDRQAERPREHWPWTLDPVVKP